jgi:tetratricopeptide (TPR) repeat protein
MIGTRFKIIDVSRNNSNNCYIIKLKLNNDTSNIDDKALDCTISNRKLLKKCISVLPEGVYNAQLRNRNIIFDQLTYLFPTEKWISAVKFYCLGIRYDRTVKNYAGALLNYDKALGIWMEHINDDELNFSTDIAQTLKNIINLYRKNINGQKLITANFDSAHMKFLTEKAARGTDQINEEKYLAIIYEQRMSVSTSDNENEKMENCLKCIKYNERCLQITLKYPDRFSSFQTAKFYKKLGDIYLSMSKYDDTLVSYKMALEIHLQRLLPNIVLIRFLSKKISTVYIENDNDYQSALKYQLIYHDYTQKANVIKPTMNDEKTTNDKKENVADSHIKLSHTYVQLYEYDSAVEHLKMSNTIFEEIKYYDHIAKGQIQLADLYLKREYYDLAVEYLTTALEYYQKHRSKKKYEIVLVQEKFGDLYLKQQRYNIAETYLLNSLQTSQEKSRSIKKKLNRARLIHRDHIRSERKRTKLPCMSAPRPNYCKPVADLNKQFKQYKNIIVSIQDKLKSVPSYLPAQKKYKKRK